MAGHENGGSNLQSKAVIVTQVAGANFLEQFDFFMFGLYARQISTAFFPTDSATVALILAFTVFGAGFLMRPLGAVVLGAYIDQAGYRKGLIVTLSIMACGTALIAFVPGYGTLGILAPILMIIGRLLQGCSVGAEMGGVSVYLAEIATPRHRGFYSSWQSASLQLSIMVSAAMGYGLSHGLSPQDLDEWGWRIPFLIGCSLIPGIFILRRGLAETGEVQAHPRTLDGQQAFRALRKHWRIVLGGMFLGAMTTCTFNLIVIYTPTFGSVVLGLSEKDSLLVTICIGLSNFIWLPIGGALSDRIGRKPVLIAASAMALICAYPVLAWLVEAPSFLRLLSVFLVFSLGSIRDSY